MPGILGLISKDRNTYQFNQMIKTINHFNYKIDKFYKDGVHLGRVHLGYVNNLPQPIFSQDKRYAIIMIGEIFSYENIESNKIINDTEFFLNKWIDNKYQCLSKMNGHFTACIYDFVKHELILISDKFGTRPIYYTFYKNKFLFGPEVKSLILDNFKREIDYNSVSDLFHFGHLFGNKTLLRNIHQLPEASYLIFHDGKINIKRYWNYQYHEEVYTRDKFTKSEIDNYTEEMKEVIVNATKRQIAKSKESILFSLSGGLDSRFVIALASKFGVQPLTAFTMGEQNSEDIIYAIKVAEMLGVGHSCFSVLPQSIWRDAEFFSYVTDGMSPIYGPVQGFDPLRAYIGEKTVTLSSQMCDAIMGSTLYRKRLKILMKNNYLNSNAINVVLNIFTIFKEAKVKSVFSKNIYVKIKQSYLSTPEKYICSNINPLHTYFKLLMNEHGRRGTLSGNIMNNLYYETRMPSYDYDFMDFAFRLPIELRKYQFIYRRAFSQMFPELSNIPRQSYNLPINASNLRFKIKSLENRIVGKLKPTPMNKIIQKFSRWNKPNYVNYKEWFTNELRQNAENIILDKKTLSRGVFDESGIRTLLNEHYTTAKDNSRLIWQIINLEYFLRQFID